MAIYNSINWPIKQTECSKLSAKCFKIQIKPTKSCQIFLTFYQSGVILPNLVTLVGSNQVNAIKSVPKRSSFGTRDWGAGWCTQKRWEKNEQCFDNRYIVIKTLSITMKNDTNYNPVKLVSWYYLRKCII